LDGKNVRLAVSWPDLRQDYHAKTKQILEDLTKQLGWTLIAAGADNDSAKQLTDAENLLRASRMSSFRASTRRLPAHVGRQGGGIQ
jgi:ABC-type sugar transport system substrate-binding protein